MDNPFVSIMLGSGSDHKLIEPHLPIFATLDIPYEVTVTSAHRSPKNTRDYVRSAEDRGCGVFITVAGLANHLSGTVAALTHKPVIGVPVASGPLHGQDALLSTVQMPPGVPVACVSIGGAKNAILLAARMLAIHDDKIASHLEQLRMEMIRQVNEQNRDLGTPPLNVDYL
ncbi:hypothetical protein LCGC14_1232580 [marine sediment metagenome]|uniref:PurE domain-containing protein n=1 Tax=marine sediment metagenome TaxID=412755 RepID=A0A0F9L837_9ZZZZ